MLSNMFIILNITHEGEPVKSTVYQIMAFAKCEIYLHFSISSGEKEKKIRRVMEHVKAHEKFHV